MTPGTSQRTALKKNGDPDTRTVIEIGGQEQLVHFREGDTGLQGAARRIMLEAEGLRAWVEGGHLVMETVAAGAGISLVVSKQEFVPPADSGAASAGTWTLTADPGQAAPTKAGATPLGDSTCVSVSDFCELINDGHAWLSDGALALEELALPPAEDRIRIKPGGGSKVTVTGSREAMTVLGFPTAESEEVESADLPAHLSFSVPGWVDVRVDGHTRRVWLDGDPARVELGTITRLPRSGEEIALHVNGGATTLRATFSQDARSLEEVALKLAEALQGEATVRVAWRYAIEADTWRNGGVEIKDVGLGWVSAGFLRRTDLTAAGRGLDGDLLHLSDTDVVGIVSDVRTGPLFEGIRVQVSAQVHMVAPDGGSVWLEAEDSDPFQFKQATDPHDCVSDAVFPVDLGRQSVGYTLKVRDSSGTAAAEALLEVNASPAVLRAVRPVVPGALPADASLSITITEPDSSQSTVTSDLAGATSEEEVLRRLQRDLCGLEVWLSGQASPRSLTVASPGGGTGWHLSLDCGATPAALGFDLAQADSDGHIGVDGLGNVPDGRRVSAEHLAAVLREASGWVTTLPALRLHVWEDGGRLHLSSAHGSVTVHATPDALLDGLQVVDSGGDAVFNKLDNYNLLNGWLRMEVGGEPAAEVAIAGGAAWVEGEVPTDPTPDLHALEGTTIQVQTISTPHDVTLSPLDCSSLASLVDRLGRDLPGVRVGLISRGSRRVLRFESHRRGDSASISVFFATNALGFAAGTTTAKGTGTVGNLARVTVAELVTLIGDAVQAGYTRQSAFRAESLDETIRVTAINPAITLSQQTSVDTAPGGLDLQNPTDPSGGGAALRHDRLVCAYSDARPMESGTLQLTLVDTVDPYAPGRVAQALLWGNPARIAIGTIAATISSLDGTTLSLTADGVDVDITFHGVTTWKDVLLQVEKQSQWRVRARKDSSALVLESWVQGSAARLALVAARTGTDALTKMTDTAAYGERRGSGLVEDLSRVSRQDYVDALQAANLGTDINQATARLEDMELKDPCWRSAQSTCWDTGCSTHHLSFVSTRIGCCSSVIPLRTIGSLHLERSLQRAPAVRASVALKPDLHPTTGSVHLSGDLEILFNDNLSLTDLAPPVEVLVSFEDGDYSAQQIATRIHRVLQATGVGYAAAYPDGVVVVETSTPGLAGTVQVPGSGSQTSASVKAGLGLMGDPLVARGWPGAGHPTGLVRGFRGRSGTSTAPEEHTWAFSSGSGSVEITVPPDTEVQVLARELDLQLKAAGTNGERIGLAMVGLDDALYVEAVTDLEFKLDKKALGTTEPPHTWLGHDRAAEPAFDLRYTDILRTYRLAYHQWGDGLEPDLHDAGWILPPLDIGASPLKPSSVRYWAPGRYGIAARAEGARTDDYSRHGEMIVSGGSAEIDGETLHFLHQVRYWVSLSGAALLGISSLEVDGEREYLVDVLRHV